MNGHLELIITGPRVYRILEISQVLSQAAVIQGLEAKTAEFTNEPLMTAEIAHIKIGREIYSPLISRNKAEAIVFFEPLIMPELAVDYLSPQGILVINTHSILSCAEMFEQVMSSLSQLTDKIIKLDITQIAKGAADLTKSNFAMLGVLSGLNIIPVEPENIIKAVEEIRSPHDSRACIRAIEGGKQAALAFERYG